MPISTHYPSNPRAYIITGPTSGIGLATASELAKHGTLVLVGRDRAKLDNVRKTIEQRRQHAVSVVCDLSEPASVQRAAAEIVALHLPIAGLLNTAGIMPTKKPTKNALGWDMTFATNHLGPFALTEAEAGSRCEPGRKGPPDARLRVCARSKVPRARRCRDARFVGKGLQHDGLTRDIKRREGTFNARPRVSSEPLHSAALSSEGEL